MSTQQFVKGDCFFTKINKNGAATSDPVAVEPYTNSLARAIEYFGADENTRFRFVTKYNDVDSLRH